MLKGHESAVEGGKTRVSGAKRNSDGTFTKASECWTENQQPLDCSQQMLDKHPAEKEKELKKEKEQKIDIKLNNTTTTLPSKEGVVVSQSPGPTGPDNAAPPNTQPDRVGADIGDPSILSSTSHPHQPPPAYAFPREYESLQPFGLRTFLGTLPTILSSGSTATGTAHPRRSTGHSVPCVVRNAMQQH